MPSTNIESPYGGGVSSLSGATGSLLPVKFPAAPVLLVDEPQLGSWQVAVVRGDETPAGDTSDGSVPVPNRIGNSRLTYLKLPDGPVVAGGPVGPCETPSPSSEENQEPLEHAVLIHADPAGQHAAVLGRCPHRTVTLLAQLARASQGALLAQTIIYKFWNRSSSWF